MRISTRLIRNALTSYMRLGTTFLLGIFLTWYMVGEVGLVGFGMVALCFGTFGMGAVDSAIRQSVVRELAAALATGEPGRVRRTVASGIVLCLAGAGVILLFYVAFSGLALVGFFNTPSDQPQLAAVLATLFLAEGFILALRMLFAPYTQAPFAAQFVGVDNTFWALRRVEMVLSAVLAFALLWRGAAIEQKLYGFAAVRIVVAGLEVAAEIIWAKLLIRSLKLRIRAFDRAEFKTIAGTVWNMGQVTLLANAGPRFIMVLVNLFFGVSYNAIYHIVGQIGGHARVIAEGILHGVDPLATHMHERGQRRAIINLMIRGIRYQLLAVLPFSCWYMIFLIPILYLWVGGRLAKDEGLESVGLTVDAAIHLTAAMGVLNLVAHVFWVSTRGVERILYGIGEVRSYAWFAKYAFLITVAGAALLMWLFDTPLVAPISLAISNFIYFMIVVPAAAVRRVDFPLREAFRRSVVRPVVTALLIGAPLIVVRLFVTELGIVELVTLVAGTGLLVVPLMYRPGLEPDERERLREIFRRVVLRRSTG